MSDAGTTKEGPESGSGNISKYRHYVLFILTLTYASSFMDRQILSILLEDIKAEFTLTDTQLGLLSGLAFALFYSTLGVPIARLADRYSRTKIIAAAMGIWSVVTILCGMAANFLQLFLARIGVGVGEAGGLAPAHSMISDYYTSEERSRAISLYSLGIVVGMIAGLLMGGYLAEHYSWRYAFVAAGIPGIILVLLMLTTVKEPTRGGLDRATGQHGDPEDIQLPFMVTLKELWQSKVYVLVTTGHVVGVFFSYALASWLPTVFIRTHNMAQTKVGALVGVILIIGMVPGMLTGGFLADRLGRHDNKWRSYVCALGILIAMPFYFFAYATDSIPLAAVLFSGGSFFINWHHAPGLAIVQTVVRPSTRAFAAAIVYFFSNMIGLALGPLLVGTISDGLNPNYGDKALPIALATMILFLPIAVWAYWLGGRKMRTGAVEKENP